MIKKPFPLKPGVGPSDASALWDRIAQAHSEADADRRDGLRLTWDDCWVHVRASNTEPIVRVIAEARTFDKARALSDQVGRWVTGAEGDRP
jgi:phosphomannomutase